MGILELEQVVTGQVIAIDMDLEGGMVNIDSLSRHRHTGSINGKQSNGESYGDEQKQVDKVEKQIDRYLEPLSEGSSSLHTAGETSFLGALAPLHDQV